MTSKSVISFSNGSSETVDGIWEETVEKIKFYLPADVGAYIGELEYGGGINVYRHRLLNSATIGSLQKIITMLLLDKMPYVTLTYFSASKNDAGLVKMNLGLTILEQTGEAEIVL